jgi:hypothetical protein
VVVEDQGRSLFDREIAEGDLKVQVTIAVRRRPDRDLPRRCEPTRDEASSAMFQPDRLAHHDAMEPGRESRRVTKVVPVSPRPLKRGLDSVLRIGAIATDQGGHAKEPLVVLRNELFERHDARRIASSEPGSLHHHTLLTR